MPAPIYLFEKGLNTVDDPRLLVPGELTSAIGAEYRLGRDTLFATGMRASAGVLGAGEHVGLVYAQYDTAASKLIAGVGTSLFEATAATSGMSGTTAVTIDSSYLISAVAPSGTLTEVTTSTSHLFVTGASVRIQGVTGTIAPQTNGIWTITVTSSTKFTLDTSVATGLTGDPNTGLVFGPNPLVFAVTPSALVGRMQFERLYLAYGYGDTTLAQGIVQRIASATVTRRQNLIRKAVGSTLQPLNVYMLQSMQAPTTDPILSNTPITSAADVLPVGGQSDSGGWINVNNASDGSDKTRARAPLSAPGTATFTWSITGFTWASHRLRILHQGQAAANGIYYGVGGTQHDPFTASIKIEVSFNGNAGTPTWQTISNRAIFYAAEWLDFAIPTGTYTTNGDIKVRVTNTFTSGSVNAQAFIWTIKVATAPAVFPLAPLGFRYLFTEWDDVNKYESGPGPESAPITLNGTTQNVVTVTLPGRALIQNNRTTHIRVYRQPEGAALGEFDKYGQIAQLDITATSFVDTFDAPLTEVARPVLPVLITGQGVDRGFYANNLAVPLASSIDFYKGSMIFVPVDDPNNVYYTPAYDVESRPALYAIPSRSSRNDRPIAVRTCDNVWMIFFQNWARRVEGIPLVVNGLFDAANYGDATTTRGISGVLAIDGITNLEKGADSGPTTWLAVADNIGIYVTNGYTIKPWSDNIDWKTLLAGTTNNYQTKTIVFSNIDELRRRVEVYFVPVGQTTITQSMYAYHGSLRDDGQPKWTGPHPVNARGVVSAYILGALERFTANGTGGQGGGATAGAVYREDPGTFLDASRSYDSSQNVRRTITTGDLPVAGLGEEGFVRATLLRTSRGAFTAIAETVSMKNSSGETMTATNTYDPAAPTPCGVCADLETVRWSGDDTGTTEKCEILGYRIESKRGGDDASALRSGLNAVAGTTALPT